MLNRSLTKSSPQTGPVTDRSKAKSTDKSTLNQIYTR